MIVILWGVGNVPFPVAGTAPPITAGTVGCEGVHPVAVRRERLQRQRADARRGGR